MVEKLGKGNPFVEISQWDPFRSPRWRYDRAAYLAKTRGDRRTYDYSRDDEYIATTFKFLKAYKHYTRSSQQKTHEARYKYVYPKYPAIYYAYQIAMAKELDVTRYELEARILARQSNEEIMDKIKMHPDAVEWYEKVFFNVRDRLDNEGYIGRRVIGPAVLHGLKNIGLAFSAKYFGYYAGPYVLDAILGKRDPVTGEIKWGADLDQYFDKFTGTGHRIRSAESVGGYDVNQFNVMQLFELHGQLINQAHAFQNAMGGAKTPFEEVVGGIMDAVNWTVGRKRQEAIAETPLKQFEGQSVELRASEMLAINSGDEVPPTLAERSTITFPPPREKKEDEDSQ